MALAGAAALAVTTGLVTTANPSQAAATKSYAYGISVNGEGKQPYVESTDGSTQTNPDASLPDNPLLSGTIAKFQAGDDYASIRIADLTVGSAAGELAPLFEQLQQLQTACEGLGEAPTEQVFDGIRDNLPTGIQLPTEEQVIDFCNALVDVDLPSVASIGTVDIECDGDSGRVALADTSVLGAPAPEPLQGDVPANTKLFTGEAAPLAQALQVTFNRQTAKPNGAFSVDGVVVEAGGGQLEIVLGHTTCGEPLPAGRAPAQAPAPAPAPDPVRQSVPVTG
jgi:hypothetical protein